MAYKFQFGDSVLGGKVTATGLEADADIDNVGDIEVDSISSADNDIKPLLEMVEMRLSKFLLLVEYICL